METTEVNTKNWKSLIKPAKLDVQLSEDKSFAKIIAEPLEKGYGLTLGNSLRRILLSSIRGTAVTSIQIDGVLHEFTSIKGVREDVTDIVLNVKSLALKSNSEGNGWGHICIETRDVYKACDDLSKLGVKITRAPGPMKHGTRVIAFCEDPDGYKVELNEKIK